jgi:hypothetical protein
MILAFFGLTYVSRFYLQHDFDLYQPQYEIIIQSVVWNNDTNMFKVYVDNVGSLNVTLDRVLVNGSIVDNPTFSQKALSQGQSSTVTFPGPNASTPILITITVYASEGEAFTQITKNFG